MTQTKAQTADYGDPGSARPAEGGGNGNEVKLNPDAVADRQGDVRSKTFGVVNGTVLNGDTKNPDVQADVPIEQLGRELYSLMDERSERLKVIRKKAFEASLAMKMESGMDESTAKILAKKESDSFVGKGENDEECRSLLLQIQEKKRLIDEKILAQMSPPEQMGTNRSPDPALVNVDAEPIVIQDEENPYGDLDMSLEPEDDANQVNGPAPQESEVIPWAVVLEDEPKTEAKVTEVDGNSSGSDTVVQPVVEPQQQTEKQTTKVKTKVDVKREDDAGVETDERLTFAGKCNDAVRRMAALGLIGRPQKRVLNEKGFIFNALPFLEKGPVKGESAFWGVLDRAQEGGENAALKKIPGAAALVERLKKGFVSFEDLNRKLSFLKDLLYGTKKIIGLMERAGIVHSDVTVRHQNGNESSVMPWRIMQAIVGNVELNEQWNEGFWKIVMALSNTPSGQKKVEGKAVPKVLTFDEGQKEKIEDLKKGKTYVDLNNALVAMIKMKQAEDAKKKEKKGAEEKKGQGDSQSEEGNIKKQESVEVNERKKVPRTEGVTRLPIAIWDSNKKNETLAERINRIQTNYQGSTRAYIASIFAKVARIDTTSPQPVTGPQTTMDGAENKADERMAA